MKKVILGMKNEGLHQMLGARYYLLNENATTTHDSNDVQIHHEGRHNHLQTKISKFKLLDHWLDSITAIRYSFSHSATSQAFTPTISM
jgi:hypothetical protein